MVRKTEPTSPFDLLGNFVKDVVTGTTGIAICYIEHQHGCNQIAIEPSDRLSTGKVQDSVSFDEQRIQFVDFGPARKSKIKRASVVLGSHVKHTINGYEGVAAKRATWVNHAPMVGIEPTVRGGDGELLPIEVFDEDMIQTVEPGQPQFSDTYKKAHGLATAEAPAKAKTGPGGPRETFGRTPQQF